MVSWIDLALGYVGYLGGLAWAVPRFRRARSATTALAAAMVVLRLCWPLVAAWTRPWSLASWIVVPGLVLLLAYRVSGVFFVAANRRLERWLIEQDDTLLRRTGMLAAYRASPGVVREAFELMYLLVYVVLPAGAVALGAGGHAASLDNYWTVVFGAELACYAVLPWLQSRPPRSVETDAVREPQPGPLRRLNLALLAHGSIQVNTLPSGHAAGALAVALAVGDVMPGAGAAFLLVAAGIGLATVLGRYHYVADSVTGLAVALVAWALLGR